MKRATIKTQTQIVNQAVKSLKKETRVSFLEPQLLLVRLQYVHELIPEDLDDDLNDNSYFSQ